jgi:hypothetical protein
MLATIVRTKRAARIPNRGLLAVLVSVALLQGLSSCYALRSPGSIRKTLSTAVAPLRVWDDELRLLLDTNGGDNDDTFVSKGKRLTDQVQKRLEKGLDVVRERFRGGDYLFGGSSPMLGEPCLLDRIARTASSWLVTTAVFQSIVTLLASDNHSLFDEVGFVAACHEIPITL